MMKKIIVIMAAICCTFAFNAQAQSLKDLFNKENIGETLGGIAESVLTNKGILKTDITGNWTYAQADCKFTTEDLAKQAGGVLVASKVSEKLSDVYGKIGIKPGAFHFQFNSDSTFVSSLGAKTLKGSYSLKDNCITLEYRIAGKIKTASVNAHIQKAGDNLSLLFNADKLLSLFGQLCSVSNIATLKTVATIAEGYDGMMLGFQMKRD